FHLAPHEVELADGRTSPRSWKLREIRTQTYASMHLKPPDVVLISLDWSFRALLRAQLIEEGHEVVAIDAWPIPPLHRRSEMKPRALVVDLRGVANLREVVDETGAVLSPEQVLLVTALGSVRADDLRPLGFNVIERPTTIGQIVATMNSILSRTSPERAPKTSATRKE